MDRITTLETLIEIEHAKKVFYKQIEWRKKQIKEDYISSSYRKWVEHGIDIKLKCIDRLEQRFNRILNTLK